MAMDFSQFDPDMQNTIKQAQQIAGLIKTQRSQQRTQPITNALSGLGEQYKSAQTDEQRQQANSLANMTRSNYLQGGGSPADLPSQNWGSDPSQGFQTAEGFQAPITGYEGLKRTDAISNRRQALTDMFEKQKWQATPESQEWYLPAAKKQTEATLANTLRSANAPYPSSGGGGASKPTQTDRQNATTSDAMQSINEAIAQGKSRVWIEDAINRATPTWVKDGVNTKAVSEYLASQKTADENQQQNQVQQATGQYYQDQAAYNDLPFWKKWGTEDPYNKFKGQ